jgi:hypothetical protein
MLLTSAPLLINATVPRNFLEAAQRVAVQLSRALRAPSDEQRQKANAQLDDGLAQLRSAAAPLLRALDLAQLTAVSSDDGSG